jgi:hypothetical protein
MLCAVAWFTGSLLVLAALYGLHRLGLYLERRDLIYYWHKKPTGSTGYNPLQEIVQPQIRHSIEVREHRQEDDDEGAAPIRARQATNDKSSGGGSLE